MRPLLATLTFLAVVTSFAACASQSEPEDDGFESDRGGSGQAGSTNGGKSGAGKGGASAGSTTSAGSGGSSAGTASTAGNGGSSTSSGGSGSADGGSGDSGGSASSGGVLGAGGSPGCVEGPSEASRTTAVCGSTVLFEGELYICISQDKNTNGEPTGCGTAGARCSEMNPDHPGWGSVAWAPVEECSGSGGAGAGGEGGGGAGGAGAGGQAP
jgi:hypothetical protein